MEVEERFFIVDGSALAYRSHFAFLRSPLTTADGVPTGAVFGYCSSLLKLVQDEEPERMVVVFDSSEPTFRHHRYPAYKATREKMPLELVDQLPLMAEATRHMGIELICIPGEEADDVIGSLVALGAQRGWRSYIVSGDKDFMQLVGERVRIYHTGRSGTVQMLGPAEVEEKIGVPPQLVADYLGLVGDTSDNIKGVPGIGPKRASRLLARFGSLEETLDRAEEVEQSSVADALAHHRRSAELAKELATIRRDVPLPVEPEALRRRSPDTRELLELFRRLEFKSLLDGVAARARGDVEYVFVRTNDQFERLLVELRNASEFSFDTETTAPEPMRAELLGISFSCQEGRAFYVETVGSGAAARLEKLRPLLEDPSRPKGAQNAKYDCLVLKRAGLDVRGLSFDTMVESYLIDPSARQHNLDALSLQYLGRKKVALHELIGKGAQQISLMEVAPEKVADYSCEDADYCLRLHKLFGPQIEAAGMGRLYRELELPLVKVLKEMEAAGVRLDTALLGKMSAGLQQKLQTLEQEIWNLSGRQFNVNSPRQLATVLYDDLEVHKDAGLKRVPRTKTGPSTSAAVLDRMRGHPVVDRVLEYRNLAKLKNTYVDALPALVYSKTGRVHTSFNQTVAATGRLSSSEPNLQNIPVRTDLGRQIRRAFIPENDDWSFLCADYNQIELRILAHLSGDPGLRETFRRGEDAHRRTASRVFGVAMGDVSAAQRSRAKVVNFGVIYGMGPQRLARETGMEIGEAGKFLESYFERYPAVGTYLEHQKRQAARTGEVRTILGRRRLLPEIRSSHRALRAAAERAAINTPVQGSAADMIKIAMLKVHRKLSEQGSRARMILQVHDEIVLEVPDAELQKVEVLVREEMESALTLSVPVKVDTWIGKTWYREA